MDGDLSITGTSCDHQFHLECALQWMEKGNDHCAYCRKDMIQPHELLSAAREALGDERVDKIVTINEMAAQRLAAYEAALAAEGSNHTEVSPQFASTGSVTGPTTTQPTATAASTPTVIDTV